MKLNIRKFGFAFGFTGALIYLGCMVVMSTVGQEGTVLFFNSILHGFDTTEIVRMEISVWEAGLGIIETFAIGWLVGACIAGIYNI